MKKIPGLKTKEEKRRKHNIQHALGLDAATLQYCNKKTSHDPRPQDQRRKKKKQNQLTCTESRGALELRLNGKLQLRMTCISTHELTKT